MQDEFLKIEPVAHIRTDFSDKFGIPRQAGRVASAMGKIVFETGDSEFVGKISAYGGLAPNGSPAPPWR